MRNAPLAQYITDQRGDLKDGPLGVRDGEIFNVLLYTARSVKGSEDRYSVAQLIASDEVSPYVNAALAVALLTLKDAMYTKSAIVDAVFKAATAKVEPKLSIQVPEADVLTLYHCFE